MAKSIKRTSMMALSLVCLVALVSFSSPNLVRTYASSGSSFELSRLIVVRPLAGPVGISTHSHSTDPQLGWSTSASYGKYGINDYQTADQEFLTNNIMIGEALTTSTGWWIHLGIGNNKCSGSTCSTCSNPPVIWGEYKYGSNPYIEVPLACASYGSTYELSIIADGQGSWFWYINQNSNAGVDTGDATINSGGSVNFIEKTGTTTPSGIDGDTHTIFTYSLEYVTSAGTFNFANPSYSSIHFYNLTWDVSPSSSWSTTITSSAPYTIQYYD